MSFTGGRALGLALTALLLGVSVARAQAWLPSAGSASTSVSYTDSWYTKHYTSTGSVVDAGHIRVFTYGFAAEYSPTDRLMVNASLPLVESEYHGAFPHPTKVDDGSYHATVTDLRTELHYQLLLEPLALSPYVAYVLPTHHYETLGHAAPGRGLHETWLGLSVGKSLDQWIPRAYVEARLTYAIVQKVQDISHDKENFDFAVGYFMTPELSAQAYVHWQTTLGGIPVPIPKSKPLFPYHDQLGADGFTNFGVASTWSYSDRSAFTFAYLTGIRGVNGHKIDSSFSFAYSYDLGRNH